jgi:hypothetical protein
MVSFPHWFWPDTCPAHGLLLLLRLPLRLLFFLLVVGGTTMSWAALSSVTDRGGSAAWRFDAFRGIFALRGIFRLRETLDLRGAFGFHFTLRKVNHSVLSPVPQRLHGIRKRCRISWQTGLQVLCRRSRGITRSR